MRDGWPFLLTTLLLLTLLTPSLYSNEKVTIVPVYDVEWTTQYWSEFEEHTYTKRTPLSQVSYEHGANLLENETMFIMRYWNPIQVNVSTMDWTEDPFNDRTWRFYFHSLRMVSFLLNAYEWSGDSAFLITSQQFIESWYEHNPTPELEANEIAWDDHSAANRLTTLIYFWDLYRTSNVFDEEFAQKFHHILYLHGSYTADKNNYLENHNHGIFQDRALIQLSVLFPSIPESPYWYVLAMNRLYSQIDFGVTESGFHKEHSPSYHFLVLQMFAEIYQFLLHYGEENTRLYQTVYNMEGSYVLMTKENGRVPMLGDSVETNIYGYKYEPIHPWMKFVLSDGVEGIEPTYGCVTIEDAKVAIIQTSVQENESYYLMMTGAFHSRVHKHADDLSFVLSLKNEDIFVDSGKYNFDENDPYRKYVRSSFAHNTVSVVGATYDLRNEDLFNNPVVMEKTDIDGGCKVSMQHTLYPGVVMTRSIWMLSEHLTIIQDQIESSTNQKFIQHFNIDSRHSIEQDGLSDFSIRTESGQYVSMQHFSQEYDSMYAFGSVDPLLGWQSKIFNSVEPIHWLGFQQEGKRIEFLTSINSHENSKVVNVMSTSSGDCIHVEFEQEDVSICNV